MDPSSSRKLTSYPTSSYSQPAGLPPSSTAAAPAASQPGSRPSSGYRSMADLINPQDSPPVVRGIPPGAEESFDPPNRDEDEEMRGHDGRGGSSDGSSSSSTSDRRYSLSIIQQPTRAAEFGTNVLSRLPLAPPLIVKLEVKDPKGNDVDIDASLPFLFAYISLLQDVPDPIDPSQLPPSEHLADLVTRLPSPASTSPSAPAIPAPPVPLPQPLRLLYGTLVSSPHQLPGSGTLFVFPDVSVRFRGVYRLRIGCMRIAGPPGDPTNPPSHESLAHIVSAPFEVTAQRDYVAPSITSLTGSLAEHGIQMYLPRPR